MMYIRTHVCVHHDQECYACAHLGQLHRRYIDLAQGPLRMRIPSKRKEEVLACNEMRMQYMMYSTALICVGYISSAHAGYSPVVS